MKLAVFRLVDRKRRGEKHSLTEQQAAILQSIALAQSHSASLNQRDIATFLCSDESTISDQLHKLSGRGLVEVLTHDVAQNGKAGARLGKNYRVSEAGISVMRDYAETIFTVPERVRALLDANPAFSELIISMNRQLDYELMARMRLTVTSGVDESLSEYISS